MDKVFQSYISHTESKYDGKKDEDQIGLLKRRHVIGEGIAYLGKEANNLEFEPLEGTKFNEYYDEKELREFILNLKPEEARKFGIKYRSTLAKVKERAKRGQSLKLHLSEMKKIAKYFHNQKVGNS